MSRPVHRAACALLFAGSLVAAAGRDAAAQDAPSGASEVALESSGGAIRVSLDEILALAGARASTVTIEDARHRVAELRRTEVRWERFPRLRFDATVSPAPRVSLERDPSTGELDPFSNRETDRELLESVIGGAGLSIRSELDIGLPLTSFGKIRLATQLADVGIEAAELDRYVAVQEARFEAYRAYRTVQWYEEVDRILREAEQKLDAAEEELEWAIDDGDRTARTTLRELVIARTDFVQLRAEADSLGVLARRAIAATLGLPPDFEPDVLDTSTGRSEVPSLETVLAYAREHRPDYARLDLASRAADLERLLRRRALTPDLYFGARIGQAWSPTVDDVSGAFINDPYNRFGFGFLVGLRWNMNPATVTARARRADAEAAVIEAQAVAAWQGIEIEVTEAYLGARGRHAVLESYHDAVRAAEAALNQVQFQYDQGLVDYDDLREPLETYYRTSAGLYEAVLRYRVAVANLALKSGKSDFTAWPSLSVE